MIKEISYNELPIDLKPHFDGWKDYFERSIKNNSFIGINWHGVDSNINAHNSIERYLEWFGTTPPSPLSPIPCKDEAFYTRELSALSSWIDAKKVVEFGTDIGIGTFLLSRLNAKAVLTSVDIGTFGTWEGKLVPLGYIAKLNNAGVFINKSSHDFECTDVDLCFVDGDHTYQGVMLDSYRAWANRNRKKWMIIWHDYHLRDEYSGLRKALQEFSSQTGITIYKLNDSATVWAYEGSIF